MFANGYHEDLNERLEDRQRREYHDEISRIAYAQPLIQDNGLFHIYNLKEDDVDRIVRRINNLDYIEWVNKSESGKYDFSKVVMPGQRQPKYYNITGKILDNNSKNEAYESVTDNYQEFIDSIKSPEQLMDWMNANITYDLPDEDYDDASTFMTKTGEELWKTKTGHCAEQSYFEKDVLENLGYKCYLIFCKEENNAQDYGSEGSAHVFLIAEKDRKYYYFEHAMEHNRGIHEFSSIKDCLAFVAKNWWRYEDTSTKLVFRKMNAPITGINNADLAKECYKLPVIGVEDISKNRIE